MKVIQDYTSGQGVQARLQSDQEFATNLQNYAAQYQQQAVQQQNAQIGKLGTAPAQMGGTSTQNIEK